MYLGHNNDFLSWKIKLLDSPPQNLFRQPIGVRISSIERLDARVISIYVILSRRSWRANILRAYAVLMCNIASSSPRSHFCQSGEPYDMHPRIILDTRRPEFPKLTTKSLPCQ